MILESQSKGVKSKNQLTPSLQKLLNRVIVRVYRGNNKKKYNREKLLSLQHSQLISKSVLLPKTNQSSPQKHSQIFPRKNEIRKAAANISQKHFSENISRRLYGSFYSQRRIETVQCRTVRCVTDPSRQKNEDDIFKNTKLSESIIFQNEDEIQNKKNKISNSMGSNRSSFKQYNYTDCHQIIMHSDVLPRENSGFTCKIKKLENKRKINTIKKTKDKMDADLNKNDRQGLIKPWQSELFQQDYF